MIVLCCKSHENCEDGEIGKKGFDQHFPVCHDEKVNAPRTRQFWWLEIPVGVWLRLDLSVEGQVCVEEALGQS